MSDKLIIPNLNLISTQEWATILSKNFNFDYDSTLEYLSHWGEKNNDLDQLAPHMPYRADAGAMRANLACELASVAEQLPEDMRSGTLYPDDLSDYLSISGTIQHLSHYPMPIGNLSQICEVTDILIACIVENRDRLVRTGLPTSFPVNGGVVSTYGLLSYPTKLPLMTRLRPAGNRKLTANYFWDSYGKKSDRPFPEASGDHICIRGMGIQYTRDGTAYDMDGKKTLPPKYEKARWNAGLVADKLRRLASLRPYIIDVKVAVLSILRDCLSRRDKTGLWPRCLDAMTNTLHTPDIDFLLQIDAHFLGWATHLSLTGNAWQFDFVHWGGLRELLQMIGFYEIELTLDHSFSKNAYLLTHIVEDRIGRRSFRFSKLGDVLKHPDASRLKRTLLNQHEMFGEELFFWAEFDIRTQAALNSEFYEQIAFTRMVKRGVSEEYRNSMERYGNALQSNLESDMELKKLDPTKRHSEVSPSVLPFHKMENLNWEEVTIKFVSHHSVAITARSVSETYTYAELGFVDRRSVDTPNSRWTILKAMAKYGEISWVVNVEQDTRNKTKAAIKDIRKLLRAAIGIKDDPFHNYRAVKAYRPKFQLVDASHSNGA